VLRKSKDFARLLIFLFQTIPVPKDSNNNDHQEPTQELSVPVLAAISREGSKKDSASAPSLDKPGLDKMIMAAQSLSQDATKSAKQFAIKFRKKNAIKCEQRKRAPFSSHWGEEQKSTFSEKPKRKQKLNLFFNKLVRRFSPLDHKVGKLAKSEDFKAEDAGSHCCSVQHYHHFAFVIEHSQPDKTAQGLRPAVEEGRVKETSIDIPFQTIPAPKDSNNNDHQEPIQKPTQELSMPVLAAISREGSKQNSSSMPSLDTLGLDEIITAAHSVSQDATKCAKQNAIKFTKQNAIKSERRKRAPFSSHWGEEQKSTFSEKPKRKQKLNLFSCFNKLVGRSLSPLDHEAGKLAKSEDFKAEDVGSHYCSVQHHHHCVFIMKHSQPDKNAQGLQPAVEEGLVKETSNPLQHLVGVRRLGSTVEGLSSERDRKVTTQRDRIDMARKHRWQARALLERAEKVAETDKVEFGYLTIRAHAHAEEAMHHVSKSKEAETKRFDLEKKKDMNCFHVSNGCRVERPYELSKKRCGLALSSSASSGEDDSSFRKREDTKRPSKNNHLWPFRLYEAFKGDGPSGEVLDMETREILINLSAEEGVQLMGSWTNPLEDNGTVASSVCGPVDAATSYAQNTICVREEQPTPCLDRMLLDLDDNLNDILTFGHVQVEETTHESARFIEQWINKTFGRQGSQIRFEDYHADTRDETIAIDGERNSLPLDTRAFPEGGDIDNDAAEYIIANPDRIMAYVPWVQFPIFISSEPQETAITSKEVIPQEGCSESMRTFAPKETRSMVFPGRPCSKHKNEVCPPHCLGGVQLFSRDAAAVPSLYSESLFC
jgi:hypothetical protein